MCGIAGQVRADGAAVDRGLIERMCAGPGAPRARLARHPRRATASASGSSGCASSTSPPATSRSTTRTARSSSSSTARSTTTASCAERLERQRPPLRHATATPRCIVHLYEEHGADCVRALHGMFAFALWDARRAPAAPRPRPGRQEAAVLLRARRGAQLRLRAAARCSQDPGDPARGRPRGARRLPRLRLRPGPAERLRGGPQAARRRTRCVRRGDAPTIERYWQLDYSRQARPRPIRRGAATSEIRDGMLDAAVRRRLIADVPLGAFLSGGDRLGGGRRGDGRGRRRAGARRSRSASTTSASTSCRSARRVAEQFGTEHHELLVRARRGRDAPRGSSATTASRSPTPRRFRASTSPRWPGATSPSRSTATAATRASAATSATRRNLLAGAARPAARAGARRGARGGRAGAAAGGDSRAPAAGSRRLRLPRRATRPDRYARADVGLRRDAERGRSTRPSSPRSLGPSAPSDADAATRGARRRAAPSCSTSCSRSTSTTYLPDDLLAKIDIATMAHSLEARSPLLDHELMELAAALPAGTRSRGRESKSDPARGAARLAPRRDRSTGPSRASELPLRALVARRAARRARARSCSTRAHARRGCFQPAHAISGCSTGTRRAPTDHGRADLDAADARAVAPPGAGATARAGGCRSLSAPAAALPSAAEAECRGGR